MSVIATQKLTGITVTTGSTTSSTATATITNAAGNSDYIYGWYLFTASGMSGGNGGTGDGYKTATTPTLPLPIYQFLPVFALPNTTNWLGYDGVTYQNKPNGTIQATFTSSSTPAANITVTILGGGGEPK